MNKPYSHPVKGSSCHIIRDTPVRFAAQNQPPPRSIMKHPFLHGFLIASSWLALSTVPHAETGTPEYDPLGEMINLPKLIRVQVEFIDVSREQLTDLMFGPKVSANDGDLRTQVAQLVKDGKANLVETMVCIARHGQKATTESIEEIIYPTEYEPASMPEEAQFKTKEEADKAKVNPRDVAIGPCPSAWETRNVGSTLEIEPTLGDDYKTIDLRFVPEIIYHVGNTVWAEWKDEHGNAPVQMPTFYTLRLNTSVVLGVGQYLMVAALSPKNKDGATDFTRKLMVFVKADVLTVGR